MEPKAIWGYHKDDQYKHYKSPRRRRKLSKDKDKEETLKVTRKATCHLQEIFNKISQQKHVSQKAV